MSKVLASERMNREEVREKHKRNICEKMREARITIEEEEN